MPIAKQKHRTREQWLNAAVKLCSSQLFKPYRFIVPKDVKVSCGFPSTGALAERRQRIGECWYPQKGTSHQIFISPVLDVPMKVLDVLVHELVHTVAGKEAKHGKAFRAIATKVGLEGKMTATVASKRLTNLLKPLNARLGPYPHESLSGMSKGRKKETCRQLKASCPGCGYTIRITRKWIDEVGLPICPGCGEDIVEGG